MNKFEIINHYLYFGYLPPKEYPAWLEDIVKNDNHEYTIQGAIKIFDETFDKLVEMFSDKKYIVPLSGGWDSRAILGALLDRVDKIKIETVSFGQPGQLDYDIGIQVAKWAGVKSHGINLSEIDFNWNSILQSVKQSPWTYVPDAWFNHIARIKFSQKNNIIWSGFLGDALSKAHLNEYSTINSQDRFLVENLRIKDYYLPNYDFEPISSLIHPVVLKMSNDDFLAPITLPIQSYKSFEDCISQETNGAVVIAPFAEKDYMNYWLYAPRELRLNQKLYLKMLHSKFPELFMLPSKYNLALPLDAKFRYSLKRYIRAIVRRIERKAPWLGLRSTAHLNYLDYNLMFRTRSNYKATLQTALDYLKENNITPWLNLDKMNSNHMKKKKNYGNVFCLLIGLAANLKVNYKE